MSSDPIEADAAVDGDTNTQTQGTVSRRRARLDISNLAEEDIDEQEITINLTSNGRLIDDELLSFVNVYFPNELMAHEAYHLRHTTNPEQNRNGSRIVWVENSQTGDMVPVVRQNMSSRRRGGKGGDGAMGAGGGDEGEDEEEGLLDLERGRGAGQQDAYAAAYANLNLNVPPLPPPLDEAQDSGVGKVGAGGGQGVVASFVQRQEQEIAPIVSYHNLVMVQRATFLVFQGLLAGFCFTTLFSVQAARGNDTKFLEFYQPISADYRRFFYILSSISLVGSVDLCLTVFSSRSEAQQSARRVKLQQQHSTTYNRALSALRLSYDTSALLLSLLLALLYGVAFVMTLLMSSFDVLTTVRDGFQGDNWMQPALHDNTYTEDMTQWKAYNTLRVICAVSAWLGSCLFVWKDLIQLNAKSADLFRLRETTVAWSSRVQEMEGGAGLDQLRPAALKKLLAILKVGTDRARDALSFYEQEQQQQQPAVAAPVPFEMELETLLPNK